MLPVVDLCKKLVIQIWHFFFAGGATQVTLSTTVVPDRVQYNSIITVWNRKIFYSYAVDHLKKNAPEFFETKFIRVRRAGSGLVCLGLYS